MVESLDELNSVFLETTIQIERIIGKQERRSSIRTNINKRRACTSGHVLGEFNKSLIQDAILFWRLLRSSPSVEEAVKRLSKYNRRYGRTVDLLATFGFDGDKQTTLELLEEFIEWRAHEHFWDSIDTACCSDKVKCILRSWKPEQDENGDYQTISLKCTKANPPSCEVCGFIQENKNAIGDFVCNAREHPRYNVAKAAEALDAILSGHDVPYGERGNCYYIADTLIALEAPEDAEIYSIDGDVHAICEILGKNVYHEFQENLSN